MGKNQLDVHQKGDTHRLMIISLLIALLPSKLKILFYKLSGHKIGKNCYIGFSVIKAKKITIGDNVRIGHFNLVWRLNHLELKNGALLHSFSWITGGETGNFTLGKNSAIQRFHFLEASANINIGSNTILAGRSSHFFTHGINSNILDDLKPIEIGDWCYIGAGVKAIPGAKVPKGTFVGMGSVITKQFDKEYTLIAGAPAIEKKELAPHDAYFNRTHLPHFHHSIEYTEKCERN